MRDLNIPSFADFLDAMGDDRADYWQREAFKFAQQNVGISFDLASPEDAQRFFDAIYAVNQRSMVLVLSDYHDWLIEKLSGRSLRLL